MKPSSWLPLLPAALLVAVAVHQIHLATTEALAPWKGGGFGMFSSTDRGHNRRLRVWVSGPERSEEMAIPRDLTGLALDTLVFPSHGALERLAREVVRAASREGGEITHVRIAVWRRTYDRESLEPTFVPLDDITLEVTDLAP